jgi:OmpA family
MLAKVPLGVRISRQASLAPAPQDVRKGPSENIRTISISARQAAQAVRDFLLKSGLDPKIVSTREFGKSDPRVKGDTAEARAKNRRVESGIVDSTLHYPGQVIPTQ